MEVIVALFVLAAFVALLVRFVLHIRGLVSGRTASDKPESFTLTVETEVDYGGDQTLVELWKEKAPLTREVEGERELREVMAGVTIDDVSAEMGLRPRSSLSSAVARSVADGASLLMDMSAYFQGEHEGMADHCARWACDCHLLVGEWKQALETHPIPAPGAKATHQMERRLSVKAKTDDRPTARELMALAGPRLTDWGQQRGERVAEEFDELLMDKIPDPVAALQRWMDGAPFRQEYPHYWIFGGLARAPIKVHQFSENHDLIEWTESNMRKAENRVRVRAGLPRVGEGWVSEAQLFRELTKAFDALTVHHHYRPDWLDGQELDIYLEEWRVGVEYQGKQHDEPVDFFGGEEAFREIQRRDARKRRQCEEEGVALIEVRPGYELEEVVSRIEKAKGLGLS